jgi:hypothetical protein
LWASTRPASPEIFADASSSSRRFPKDIELNQRVLGAVEHVAPDASICGAVDVGVRTRTVSLHGLSRCTVAYCRTPSAEHLEVDILLESLEQPLPAA